MSPMGRFGQHLYIVRRAMFPTSGQHLCQEAEPIGGRKQYGGVISPSCEPIDVVRPAQRRGRRRASPRRLRGCGKRCSSAGRP